MRRPLVFGNRAVLVKPAAYKTRDLPPDEWHRCGVCCGRGHYLMSGDAHRSEGIVPCTNCHGGIVKRETVMISKPVYRVKAARVSKTRVSKIRILIDD